MSDSEASTVISAPLLLTFSETNDGVEKVFHRSVMVTEFQPNDPYRSCTRTKNLTDAETVALILSQLPTEIDPARPKPGLTDVANAILEAMRKAHKPSVHADFSRWNWRVDYPGREQVSAKGDDDYIESFSRRLEYDLECVFTLTDDGSHKRSGGYPEIALTLSLPTKDDLLLIKSEMTTAVK